MKTFLFLISLLSVPLIAEEMRISEGPFVEISRVMESKEVVYHIECSKGINVDASISCSLIKKVSNTPVRVTKISPKTLDSLLGEFFAALPSEQMAEKKTRARADEIKWKINFNERKTAGIAAHEHSPGTEQEKLWREATRKALLMLQDSFEIQLNFSAS